jgi:hypothetical protein
MDKVGRNTVLKTDPHIYLVATESPITSLLVAVKWYRYNVVPKRIQNGDLLLSNNVFVSRYNVVPFTVSEPVLVLI